MKFLFLLTIIFFTIYAKVPTMLDINASKANAKKAQESVIYEKHYNKAKNVNIKNVKVNKNTQQEIENPAQWKKYFTQQAKMKFNAGSVGNMEAYYNNNKNYQQAKSSNINNLTTNSIKDSSNKAILASQNLLNNLRSKIFTNSISHMGNYGKLQNIEQKCSIKRDITANLGYKCYLPTGESGGFYSSNDKGLKELHYDCMSDCYTKKRCSEVRSGTYQKIFKKEIIFDTNQTLPIKLNTNIENVSFDINDTNDTFLTLWFKKSDTNLTIYNNLPMALDEDGNISLNLNVKNVKEMMIQINSDTKKSIKLTNLKIMTENETPYYTCPYASVMGDTPEGYFTSDAECNNNCVLQGICKLYLPKTIFLDNTSIVNNCPDKISKYKNCKLKTEYVDYYGNGNLVKTVSNYALVPNTIRPKIYASDNNLTKTIEQETKDNAYANMQKYRTYDVVENPFSSDTNASYAYRTVLKGSREVNLYGNEPMGLDVIIKPKRFQIGDNNIYKVYGILEVVVDYLDPAINKHIRDKIYYILASPTKAIPFERVTKYATIAIVNYIPGYNKVIADKNLTKPELVPLGTARTHWQTFHLNSDGTGEWIPFDKNSDASSKYLWEGKFDSGSIMYEIKFIDDFDDFLAPTDSAAHSLPGIYRRIDNNLKKYYTGNRGIGGQSIVKLKAYVYYAKANKKVTFEDLLKNAIPFYETGNEGIYSRTVDDDSVLKNNGIKIYVGGKAKKVSVYTTIKVRPEFVGKPGFIFVFLGD